MSRPARPAVVTRPTTERTRRAVRRFRVVVTGGPSRGRTWSVARERCAIGSHVSNDLVIEDPTVSRFHCELAIAGDRVRVRDLDSRNGTLFAGAALADASLPTNAILALGNSDVRVEVADDQTEIEASDVAQLGCLVGASPPMREVFSQLEKVARTDVTVLLEGETGTGKEGAAEAIHDLGPRADGPFVVVDCGAIPTNLLEAELFGFEAGAFTGATERRIGAFEAASGGTLFLDEIGELAPELQPKLLRALESREIRRIGGRNLLACDFRLVAATNRDLRAEVNRGSFRADLYFRLGVVKIELPTLRTRAGDMPLLVAHLLERLRAPADVIAELTTPDFIAALAAAPWPGNVRELRNHLEQCVVLRERRTPSTLPARSELHVDSTIPYDTARREVIEAFERSYVRDLLARSTNVSRAAREVGLNRGYLYRLIQRHGLR